MTTSYWVQYSFAVTTSSTPPSQPADLDFLGYDLASGNSQISLLAIPSEPLPDFGDFAGDYILQSPYIIASASPPGDNNIYQVQHNLSSSKDTPVAIPVEM